MNRYRIREAIADGGMAHIYHAWDESAQINVAIKRLYPYFMANEVVRKRFISEGKIQQILTHPNIVRVFDIIERPMLAIVMELVEGYTLDEYLLKQGRLKESEVLEMIIPILSAIGFAHQRGIIHRDIKPSNVLISKTDTGFSPRIMDFGVAKIKGQGTSLTATGTTVGTLHYMSPEQIVGSKSIDGRADIYSLGVTLYKLVTGEVPFNAPTEFALMMAQVEASPLPPSQLRPGMSKDLEAIILKAMAKKASDRFQTIREFTHALMAAKFEAPRLKDTVTDRISVEVLQYAMDADVVGQDLTGDMMRISAGDFPLLNADTQEQTQKLKAHSNAFVDETIELSSDQLLAVNEQITAKSDPIVSLENITLKASAIPKLGVHDTIEYSADDPNADTVALKARVGLKSQARIVFDHAESQDLTAPKISQEAYDRVMKLSDSSQDKTKEKPQFRTQNPGLLETGPSPAIQKPNPRKDPPPSDVQNHFSSGTYLQRNASLPPTQAKKFPSGFQAQVPQPHPPTHPGHPHATPQPLSAHPPRATYPPRTTNLQTQAPPPQNQATPPPRRVSSGVQSMYSSDSIPPINSPGTPVPYRPNTALNNEDGFDLKFVLLIVGGLITVVVALTFLIFSILF